MISQKSLSIEIPTIVHVLNGFSIGGVENLCLQLLKHSPEPTQTVLINLDPTRQEMLTQFQHIPNLVIVDHPYAPQNRVLFVWKLATYLRTLKPQAILIYPFGLHIFVGLAARLAQISAIATTAQNTLPPDPAMQRKWASIVRLSNWLRIPIYSCSLAVQQSIQQVAPLPKGSSVIPNGCNVEAIAQCAETSRRSRQERDRLILGMVARLNSIKDQATLIRACGHLHKTHPQVELWLIGDGVERDYLKQLCTDLDLTNTVKFWGARSDVPDLLGQMDIYAFSTTEEEGFGIALTEAMAASLPIIASDVNACREVLGEGEAGVLVPSHDPVALAKALEAFILSPNERQQWGQRAYHRVTHHYSIQTCAQRWYRLLLSEKHC